MTTKAEVPMSIVEASGIICDTAEQLGVTPSTLFERLALVGTLRSS